ncbi:unnamed protein product, partial [Ilex paraguariensis]
CGFVVVLRSYGGRCGDQLWCVVIVVLIEWYFGFDFGGAVVVVVIKDMWWCNCDLPYVMVLANFSMVMSSCAVHPQGLMLLIRMLRIALQVEFLVVVVVEQQNAGGKGRSRASIERPLFSILPRDEPANMLHIIEAEVSSNSLVQRREEAQRIMKEALGTLDGH